MIKKITILAVIVVVAAVAYVGYTFFRAPEEASAPIEAVPLSLEENDVTEAAPVEDPVEAAPESEPVTDNSDTQTETAAEAEPETEPEAAAEPAPETEGEVAVDSETIDSEAKAVADVVEPAEVQKETVADSEATTAEVEEATATPETDAEALAEEVSTGPTLFEIVPGESEARFMINEVLQGDPITVVGATDQVAGQLALDPADLSTAQVGVIQVNARTLATDNNFRNRAIKNRILLTDDYEFVTFNPTEIIGLPESAAVGETITFQVMGDLTVTDATRQVIFDITATPVSLERIEGTASTAFLYTDFELYIPAAQLVDAVDDEVRLEIDFVAHAVSEVAG